MGKTDDAMTAFRQALAIRQELADENPDDIQFRTRLSNAHNNIGLVLADTVETDEALESYRRSLAIQQKLADENPTVTDFRRNLANTQDNTGLLLSKIGKIGRGAGYPSPGTGDPAEAGRRQPRRHRVPEPPGA